MKTYILLADKIIPSSTGTRITVPKIQNNNRYGILGKRHPNTRYARDSKEVGIKTLDKRLFVFMLYIAVFLS